MPDVIFRSSRRLFNLNLSGSLVPELGDLSYLLYL